MKKRKSISPFAFAFWFCNIVVFLIWLVGVFGAE